MKICKYLHSCIPAFLHLRISVKVEARMLLFRRIGSQLITTYG